MIIFYTKSNKSTWPKSKHYFNVVMVSMQIRWTRESNAICVFFLIPYVFQYIDSISKAHTKNDKKNPIFIHRGQQIARVKSLYNCINGNASQQIKYSINWISLEGCKQHHHQQQQHFRFSINSCISLARSLSQ